MKRGMFILLALTLVGGCVLLSNNAMADDSAVSTASITVPVACTMQGAGMGSHMATLAPNTYSGASGSEYENGIGKTTLTAICNDDNGFSIYAIGYTGNSYDSENHTKLVGSNTGGTISTKAYASGDTTSNWSMKLTKVTDITESYNPQNLTIQSDTEGTFSNWHSAPNTYTKVAEYHANTGSSTTDTTLGVKLETTYAAFVASNQPADTYIGQVKYTMVHPYMAVAGKLNVTYDGNGLLFPNGKNTNLVTYDSASEEMAEAITEKSYTNAYNEEGEYNSSTIGAFAGNKVITISGAENIHIRVTYGVPQNSGGPQSDLFIWGGNHPNYTNVDNATSLSKCGNINATNGAFRASGNPGSQVTMECDIAGDSVTFYDYGNGYMSAGYYALVTGTASYNKTSILGTYQIPVTRTGQDVFLGWSTNPTANADAEEPLYIDELDFLANAPYLNVDGQVILYAVWGKTFAAAYTDAGKPQLNEKFKMQDISNALCEEVYVGAMGTLVDTRDSQNYTVGRLKDGNCWMLENLYLDLTDATTVANINERNTNASALAISNLFHGGSSTVGWGISAVINKESNFDSDGYTSPYINTTHKNRLVTGYGPASMNGQSKVGIYYNFCAASASTYCYGYGEGIDIPDTLADTQQDVCPSNWRLPTGRNNGEYGILAEKYSNGTSKSDTLQYNLSAPLSGYYIASTANGQESYGTWWSSTFSNDLNMSYLYITSTSAVFQEDGTRLRGQPIRCLVSD